MVVPVPATSRARATTVVVGTGKSGVVIGMNPSTGAKLWETPVGLHRNDHLKALKGPTTVLPGTFGGVLTPPASARGDVYVATLNAPDTRTRTRRPTTGAKPGPCRARW
jgi:hypothetical protein